MTVVPRRDQSMQSVGPRYRPGSRRDESESSTQNAKVTRTISADAFSRVHHLVHDDPRLDPYDVRIYAYGLSRDWGGSGSKLVASYTRISLATGIGETKVCACLKILLETGLFTLFKRGGRGLANEYRVTQAHAVPAVYSGEVTDLIFEARALDVEDQSAVSGLRRKQRAIRAATIAAAQESWKERHVPRRRATTTPDGRTRSPGGFRNAGATREKDAVIRKLERSNEILAARNRRLDAKLERQKALIAGEGATSPAGGGPGDTNV